MPLPSSSDEAGELMQPLLDSVNGDDGEEDGADGEELRKFSDNCRSFGPLYWVSKENLQFLQSGNARMKGDVISYYHQNAWRRLPPHDIFPLSRRSGIGAFSDGGNNHYKVVCLKVIGEFIEWSCYSSRYQMWIKMEHIELGPKRIRTNNMIISNDGQTIYLTSRAPPALVSIDIKEQKSTFMSLNPDKELYPQEHWLDTDVFALAKCEYKKESERDLCMIRYCRSSKIFSIWVLPCKQQYWIKLDHVTLESFKWPGLIRCFAFVRRLGVFVMALKNKNFYHYYVYDLNNKGFTKLERPSFKCSFSCELNLLIS